MAKLKIIILIIITLMSFNIIISQQIPAYSQYWDNMFMFNPALAGSTGYTILNVMSRIQSVGIPGAPVDNSVSIEGRVLKDHFRLKSKLFGNKKYIPKTAGKVGLGCYIYDDRNGLIDRTGVSFAYAYHIFLKSTQVSFGLALSVYQFKLDFSKMIIGNAQDPVVSGSNSFSRLVSPDASAGIYFLNHSYFAGLSVMSLMQSALKIGDKSYSDYQLLRHYYLFGGWNFNLGKTDIVPSILVKTSEQFQSIQSDFTCKVE